MHLQQNFKFRTISFLSLSGFVSTLEIDGIAHMEFEKR